MVHGEHCQVSEMPSLATVEEVSFHLITRHLLSTQCVLVYSPRLGVGVGWIAEWNEIPCLHKARRSEGLGETAAIHDSARQSTLLDFFRVL